MIEEKPRYPMPERNEPSQVTESRLADYRTRLELWQTGRSNRLAAEFEHRRLTAPDEFAFLESLYKEMAVLGDKAHKRDTPEEINDRYWELRELWRMLPEEQQELFETSSQLSSGDRIPFEQLTLENICGNLYPDYLTNQMAYSEWHIGASFKGPAHWLPRKKEIERFAQIAEVVAGEKDLPRVLEIGAGTGLLSLLLAQTGRLNVTGMDPNDLIWEDSEESPVYSHPNLKLHPGTSKASVFYFKDNPPEIVVSSWMTSQADLTEDINSLSPKAIIYIYSSRFEDMIEDGDGQFGIRYLPKPGYHRAFSWRGPDHEEVLDFWQFVASEKGSKKTRGMISSEELVLARNNNIVEIHLRDDIADFTISDPDDSDTYPWEDNDLFRILSPDIYTRFIKKPKKLALLREGLDRLLTVEDISNSTLGVEI